MRLLIDGIVSISNFQATHSPLPPENTIGIG